MIRLDLSYFYRLGANFTSVRGLDAPQEMIGVWLALDGLANSVRQVLTDTSVGRSLRGAFAPGTALLEHVTALTTRNLDDQYTVFDKSTLSNRISSFEIVLTSELAVSDAYFVLEKKPYNTLTLVTEGEALFPIDLARKVPEAINDLREAGKCLAFELPTAAAFHLMRAIESVLRRYWMAVSENMKPPKQKTIGVYLAAMKKHGCGDPKVIAALEQIKDLHRNAIMHPEISLNQDEASSLAGIANSVASAMLRELPFVPADPPPPDDQSFPDKGEADSGDIPLLAEA